MFRKIRVALAVLAVMATPCFAWQYPWSSDVKIVTNGLTHITATNLQAAMAQIDANAIWSGSGYVTESTLDSRLSSSSTQVFGIVSVAAAPTSAVVRLNEFMGFVTSFTNGGSFWVTNLALYGQVTGITNEAYDAKGWFASDSKFTPKVEGYYLLSVDALGSTTCGLRVVSYNTNQIINIGTTIDTNSHINGSGIMWFNGTSTNTAWLEGICWGGAPSSRLDRVVFQGTYLGR